MAIQTIFNSILLVAITQFGGGGPGQIGFDATADAVTASFVADSKSVAPGKSLTVGVKLDVPPGYYTYYHSPGDIGLPTQIQISAPDGFRVGALQFPGPEVKREEVGDETKTMYVYHRSIMIIAEVTPPDELIAGGSVEIAARVSYQYCREGACVPAKPQTLKLKLPIVDSASDVKPSPDAPAFAEARRALPQSGVASLYAKVHTVLSQDLLRPGDTATLGIVIDIEPGFKIQMHRPPQANLISTEVILHSTPGLAKFANPNYPEPDPTPIVDGGFEVKEYHNRVVVTVPVIATDKLSGPAITISGLVQYQACQIDGGCFAPEFASFELAVPVVAAGAVVQQTNSELFAMAGAAPARPNIEARPAVTEKSPPDRSGFEIAGYIDAESAGQSTGWYMLYAFLGGFILNFMPCVLPVIAIKVLGFVQQAGESRGRILLLNVAYAAGVVTVFLALATLAVVLSYGWGQLFQSARFNLVMAGLVFAMGLSLLGVFDVPVPGFIGSTAAGTHQEGPLGAFLTGVLATLLATPCSGPFLGVTLGWSVRQPPPITYAIWALMGLGMASPYLVIGMFPAAIRRLPKPGNWMVTFKELAGLVLMGTVVYIMSFIDSLYVLPTLVMLIGLAVGLWIIGQWHDINASAQRKMLVRVVGLSSAVGVCVFAFTVVKGIAEWRQERDRAKLRQAIVEELDTKLAGKLSRPISSLLAELDIQQSRGPDTPASAVLDWKPFSENLLRELIEQKRTVLVDFTADWCLTCKLNEKMALNTEGTRRLIDQMGAIPLVADYTDRSPAIEAWLRRFDSISVPLTVIFPARDPQRPILLRDAYTESKLHEKLRSASGTITASRAASPAILPATETTSNH